MITFKEFFEEEGTNTLPIAPAIFVFYWDLEDGKGPQPVFNMIDTVQGKPLKAGSTVSQNTLEKHGFYVPPIPQGTPKNTPLASLDDRVKSEGRQTKKNPFGFDTQQIFKPNQRKVRLPPKVFKREMKSKPNKRDLLKPRRWQVNSIGKLIRLFQ